MDSYEKHREEAKGQIAEEDNSDRDLQVTLHFADGSEQTFTVIRDQNMRWNGSVPGVLVKIEAEWFDNPAIPVQEATE